MTSPVLTPEALRALARDILAMTTADTASVTVSHRATRVTRIARNRVQRLSNGETLQLEITTAFGSKGMIALSVNQLDPETLRAAVAYTERVAHESIGDPALTRDAMPIPPRQYLDATCWFDTTAAALSDDRHDMVEAIVQPMIAAKLIGAAFIGASAYSTMYANKQGILAAGQSTDAELIVTGWSRPSATSRGSSGWAGQAARDWTKINPDAVVADTIRFARGMAEPVAFEPGRRVAILGRPAMAQIVATMGRYYDAAATHAGETPLSGHKLNDKIWDERLTLSSDPNDPDGGYLPFDDRGDPRIPMTWINRGRLENLAYGPYTAAYSGVTPANPAPESVRLGVPTNTASTPALQTIEEMIANCKEGIYVNRVADIEIIHGRSGLLSGVTNGGCFLIRNGKIEKAVKDFRFLDSPYFFLNRLVAVGTSERTAFGYAPWHGEWPLPPTIVPPVMVRDFNFVALADNV